MKKARTALIWIVLAAGASAVGFYVGQALKKPAPIISTDLPTGESRVISD